MSRSIVMFQKAPWLFIIGVISQLLLSIQGYSQAEIYLWDGIEKPFYKENDLKEYEKEAWGTSCLYDITEPTLTIFKPLGQNSGKAVMIIPGGGYDLVAIHHEGYDVAKKLSEQGITAAVLKYRLPKVESSDRPEQVPLSDARRGLEILRQHSESFGFEKSKVGVVGFSAGSHLATLIALWKSGNELMNPDFTGLIYGVTDLSDENLTWLEQSLYHRSLTKEEIEQNTLLNLVSKESPPAFIVHAYDDDVCQIKESTLYAQKIAENKVAVEMHLFPHGGHGFGVGRQEDGTDQWVPLFINWIKKQ